MSIDAEGLRIEGVGKAFRRRRVGSSDATHWALRDVTLELSPGKTLGVVGESGAGKSTLGRCVLGLERVTTGRIMLGTTDLARLRGSARRRLRSEVGVIFQDPYSSLNPRWTLERIVAHPLRVRGRRRGANTRARGLLADVGLPDVYAHRQPAELSGGERQRVAIARALVLEPRIVVCDEPTSALDVSVQAQIVNLLRDVQDRTGVAYLFISHDIAVVRAVSDRLAVMHAGRIVEQGPCQQVLADPTEPYTRELIAAVPMPPPLAADHPANATPTEAQ